MADDSINDEVRVEYLVGSPTYEAIQKGIANYGDDYRHSHKREHYRIVGAVATNPGLVTFTLKRV